MIHWFGGYFSGLIISSSDTYQILLGLSTVSISSNGWIHHNKIELFVSRQGKQLWSWNKYQHIPDVVIRSSCHNFEVTALSWKSGYDRHCHNLMRQVFPRQRFLDYYLLLSHWVLNLLHRAFTAWKLHKRRSFTPGIMADQTVNKAV